MPDTTTAPSAEEIGAAIALLRGIPGVTEQHTLEDIAEISTPLVQLARSLHEWLTERKHQADVGQLASVLDTLATAHGLHITADPAHIPAAAWKEPADWPIPGHAPGLYTAYSIGDGVGPAVITEDGRLLIKQHHPTYWSDLTDVYQSAKWPLTPVTVRTIGGQA